MRYQSVIMGAVVGVFGSAAIGGPIWEECRGNDAGNKPGTAQIPNSQPQGTPLEEICGKFDPMEPMDQQDMFLVEICDPSIFSASLTVTSGSLNAQLWVFDASGFGILGNDDSTSGTNPMLGNFATDGSGASISAPGFYYIAVSLFDSDPLDNGLLPLFNQATTLEVSGPDGPGGANMIEDWSPAISGQSGEYNLRLTGTCYAPSPGALAVLPIMGLLGARRRR